MPATVWAVIALYAIPGLYVAWTGLHPIPSVFSLGGYDDGRLEAALVALLILIAALGLALVAIAWLLYRADRVGRGLAYVASGMLLSVVLFEGDASGGYVISVLAAIGASLVLAFEPSSRSYFTGPLARNRDEPTGVVVARIVVVVFSFLLGLFGLVDLLLERTALGILFLALCIGAAVISRRLTAGDRSARVVATVGAGVAIILMLAGEHDAGFVLGIGLAVAVPICLWVPTDVKVFFGDTPSAVSDAPS